ncbi:hypothetical protein MCP1_690007 [Candidatus Terasakiella magnetica]|nr:hypothetical protein MCP1_690007 [Candidatus Terasakiella magnetica]
MREPEAKSETINARMGAPRGDVRSLNAYSPSFSGTPTIGTPLKPRVRQAASGYSAGSIMLLTSGGRRYAF